MKNFYQREKFTNAVSDLATSPKSIQQRVCDAYLHSLIHVSVDSLPEEIQKQFQDMNERLTKSEPEGDEGSVKATTRDMSEDEASEIATEIWNMYCVIESDFNES